MKSQKVTESPESIAARTRERRLSELDALQTGQEQAAGLTSDLRSIYGFRKLKNQNPAATPVAAPKTTPTTTPTPSQSAFIQSNQPPKTKTFNPYSLWADGVMRSTGGLKFR